MPKKDQYQYFANNLLLNKNGISAKDGKNIQKFGELGF